MKNAIVLFLVLSVSVLPEVVSAAGGKPLNSLDGIVNDFYNHGLYDFDPEYASILAEIDRQHSLYKLTHRDLQWKTVAGVMQELDNDERVELITHVRRYPLHRRLPATVAMTPTALGHWQQARKLFLQAVRRGK